MSVEVSPMAYKLRSIVFGIRPSIAWIAGTGALPLDNLSAEGVTGWELGVHNVLREPSPHPDFDPILKWLELLPVTAYGSVAAVDVLGSLRQVIPALHDPTLGSLTNEAFAECWATNLTASAEPETLRNAHIAAALAQTCRAWLPASDDVAVLRSALTERTEGIASEMDLSDTPARLLPPLHLRSMWANILLD